MKDKIEELEKLANQDNCGGRCDLGKPYEKCPECEARRVLNEMGEILRNTWDRSEKTIKKLKKAIKINDDDLDKPMTI